MNDTITEAEASILLQTLPSRAGRRLIVTGQPGMGKSTWCAALIEQARARGLTVRGVLSPPAMDGARKIGIDVVNLASGERRRLANLRQDDEQTEAGITTVRWRFDAEALTWGSEVLRAAGDCDLLVIDELGPLEFFRGMGWRVGLSVVDARQYGLACVVVRPSLTATALARWPDAQVVDRTR